jgi:O-antigen/teichoic acid export membrane protein
MSVPLSEHESLNAPVTPSPVPLLPEAQSTFSLISKLGRLKQNHLLSNSLYLMLSSGLQAAAGFLFWIISAHLFNGGDVGQASSLYAAEGVIADAALLGLNSTIVRYLPTAKDRNVFITTALALVSISAAIIAFLYVIVIPYIAPRLAFVTHKPALAIGFVLLSVAVAVNMLTDSIFIGLRKSGYNALVDGGIGGVAKLAGTVIIAGAGAYELFVASSAGFVVAALASIILIARSERFHPTLRGSRQLLKPLLRFSGANYLGNVLMLLPNLVVPLIVLDRLGVHDAAYYYIGYQMAALLYAAVYAIEQTFLAEGSHDDVNLRQMMRRSWRLLAGLCIPASIVLAGSAHWLLLLFGGSYSAHSTDVLIILALTTLPFGAFYWLLTVLRLIGKLNSIVAANIAAGVLTCVLAWILAPHGLSMLVLAWPIGLTAAAITAAVPVWRWSRDNPPPESAAVILGK